MSKTKRLLNIIIGILTIIIAIIMQIVPEVGYGVMILFMGIGLTFSGITQLGYYITMARYMVDGKLVLYRGVIFFNLGVFTLTMANIPRQYAMIYLLIYFLFSAAVSFLRAMEAKTLGATSWKWIFVRGILQILIAVIGLLTINSVRMVMLIYGLGIIESACERIASAFRRTTIVYVQ